MLMHLASAPMGLMQHRKACHVKGAVPFRQGHTIACVFAARVALDLTPHASQCFGKVFRLLLHQRHEGQDDQRLHVPLEAAGLIVRSIGQIGKLVSAADTQSKSFFQMKLEM